jgi:outer membrane receptor protein involved in Fe transport
MTIFCARRRVLTGSLALALAAPCAIAQTSAASSGDQGASSNPKTLDKVTVTGSRIPRSEIEGDAPVSVITGEQIKAQGYTTLYEFLGSMPQVSTPEFGNGISTWGNNAANARSINLRNLGADHTLLLINGYRVTDYPVPGTFGQSTFQNYNNIPVGMVDHIEVLGSGASSIYGSDAVAGVINVILKKTYQGDNIKLTGGGATRGGRAYGDFLYTGGRSGEKWHLLYTYEHTNRSPLWGRDRPYTDAQSDAGYGAWNPSQRLFGFGNGAGLALTNGANKQVDGGNGPYIAPPAGACGRFGNNFSLYHKQTVATSGNQVLPGVMDGGYYCQQNADYGNWVLSPGLRADNFYVAGDYQLTEKLQAYGSVGLFTNTGTTNTQLPGLGPIAGLPGSGNSVFYDQTTGQVIGNYSRQLTPQELGSYGNTHTREKNWDIHAGLRGRIFDDRFNWDFNVGSSKYIVHQYYTGLNQQGMFDFFFGPQLGNTTINGVSMPVYALNAERFWNPITPSQYATFGVNGEDSAYTWMNQAVFNLNGDLFEMGNGQSVGFAGVLEVNHQGFHLAPDPRGNTLEFSNPFQNYITGGGTRTRYSAATEFRVPLLDSLTWTISGRLDKYQDHSVANIAKTYGIGLEWRPIDGLLLRGTYGTNFHAPDMQAIYLANSQQTVGFYADPLLRIQTGDRTCQAYQHSTYFPQYQTGSRELLPETGHSWTYGFVWDVPGIDGLSVSVDYWKMGINNAIKWIGQGTALDDEAGCRTGLQVNGAPYVAHAVGSAYCQQAIHNVTRDASGNIVGLRTGPINVASLYVSGVDSTLTYKYNTSNWGSFKFDLNYTNNLSYQERDLPSDPLVNTRYNYPATKTVFNANWHINAWDFTLHGERTGGVRAPNYGGCVVLPNGIQPGVGDADCVIYKGHYPNWVIFSTAASYAINDKLKVGLNIANIFDKVGVIPYYAGGFEYIATNQGAGYVGREVFLSLDWKID